MDIAGLEVELHGGTDQQGGGDGPLVILLHGYGAPGTDLVGLWRMIPTQQPVRFAFPAAPLKLDMGFGDARAWWQIDMIEYQTALMRGEERNLAGQTPDVLPARRSTLDQLIAQLRASLNASHV